MLRYIEIFRNLSYNYVGTRILSSDQENFVGLERDIKWSIGNKLNIYTSALLLGVSFVQIATIPVDHIRNSVNVSTKSSGWRRRTTGHDENLEDRWHCQHQNQAAQFRHHHSEIVVVKVSLAPEKRKKKKHKIKEMDLTSWGFWSITCSVHLYQAY